MSKGKRIKKKQAEAQRQAAEAKKKAAAAAASKNGVEQKPKPQTFKCFEVHLQLINAPKELKRDVRQYFHQPKGTYQAIVDSINFVHHEVERYLRSLDGKAVKMAVDKVEVYEWSLAVPTGDGSIPTKRNISAVFEWNYADKIKVVVESLSKKQKRRLQAQSVYLDKYRPVRTTVVFEEIGQDICDEPGVPLRPVCVIPDSDPA